MNRSALLSLLATVPLLLTPALVHAGCLDQTRPWSLRLGGHSIDATDRSSRTAAGEISVRSKAAVTFNVDYRLCEVLTIDLLAALPVTQGIAIDGSRVASTQHLPPTLTLQYHPRGAATIDPYVGVGINHTFFFREALPGATLQLSDTWGYAGQIGIDWHVTPVWSLGVDVRYLRIEPDASVNGAPIGKVDINPLAWGGTISYRF